MGSGTRLRAQGDEGPGEGEDESAEGTPGEHEEASGTTSGRRRIAREHLGLVRVRACCSRQ